MEAVGVFSHFPQKNRLVYVMRAIRESPLRYAVIGVGRGLAPAACIYTIELSAEGVFHISRGKSPFYVIRAIRESPLRRQSAYPIRRGGFHIRPTMRI